MRDLALLDARLLLAPLLLVAAFNKLVVYASVIGYFGELGGPEPSCLIPGFDGATLSAEWKDALWDRFYTAAPQRLRQSVEQYRIVKRA